MGLVALLGPECPLEEEDVARACLPVLTSRMSVPRGARVLARYGLWPDTHYRTLQLDLGFLGATPINSFSQHAWVAGFDGWGGTAGVLSGLTPRSWRDWSRLPQGAYVVKGVTNSRKSSWNRRMFAATREDVPRVAMSLLDDYAIAEQGLVVREYVPLEKLGEGLNGLPVSNEWRTFWLVTTAGPRLLTSGFYWEQAFPGLSPHEALPPQAEALARVAAERVAPFVNFFVVDVAKTAAGAWIVIEINDGQMSGLCGCSASDLYSSFREEFP